MLFDKDNANNRTAVQTYPEKWLFWRIQNKSYEKIHHGDFSGRNLQCYLKRVPLDFPGSFPDLFRTPILYNTCRGLVLQLNKNIKSAPMITIYIANVPILFIIWLIANQVSCRIKIPLKSTSFSLSVIEIKWTELKFSKVKKFFLQKSH